MTIETIYKFDDYIQIKNHQQEEFGDHGLCEGREFQVIYEKLRIGDRILDAIISTFRQFLGGLKKLFFLDVPERTYQSYMDQWDRAVTGKSKHYVNWDSIPDDVRKVINIADKTIFNNRYKIDPSLRSEPIVEKPFEGFLDESLLENFKDIEEVETNGLLNVVWKMMDEFFIKKADGLDNLPKDDLLESYFKDNFVQHMNLVARVLGLYTASLQRDKEGPDKFRIGKDHNILGECYILMDQVKKAVKHFKKALIQYAEIPGKENEKAIVLTNLGLAYSNLEQGKEAIAYYESALALHNSDDEQTARILRGLGEERKKTGDFEKATYYYQLALPKIKNSLMKRLVKMELEEAEKKIS